MFPRKFARREEFTHYHTAHMHRYRLAAAVCCGYAPRAADMHHVWSSVTKQSTIRYETVNPIYLRSYQSTASRTSSRAPIDSWRAGARALFENTKSRTNENVFPNPVFRKHKNPKKENVFRSPAFRKHKKMKRGNVYPNPL